MAATGGTETGVVENLGRRWKAVAVTAISIAVVLSLILAGVLVSRTGGGDEAAATTTTTTFTPAKGATLDTTTTSTSSTTTVLQEFAGEPDPDAPADVDLTGDASSPPEPVGEPFIPDPPAAVSAVELASFSPDTGAVGTAVRILGAGFDRVVAVSFNGVRALSFTAVSSSELVTSVPPNATTGTIRVVASDGTETPSVATFTATSPAITSFVPASAAIGASITINGFNLDGTTTVSFSGVEVAPTSVSATMVTAVVPGLAVTGRVTVRTASMTATSATDLSISSAVITSLTPADAAPGKIVTITGANFTGATSVRFGGVSASYKVVSPTTITATVPSAGLSGNVTVATPAGTAISEARFIMPPRFASTWFDVSKAAPGAVVTLYGSNLDDVTSVRFFGSEQSATFSVPTGSTTQLRVVVPDDAQTGGITLFNAAGSVTSGTWYPLPVITELVPATGPAGTVVTVLANNLSGIDWVKYGTTTVSFTYISPREVRFTVPAAATTSAAVSLYVGSIIGGATGPTFSLAPNPEVVLPGTAPAATVTAPTPAGGTTSTAAQLVGQTSVALGGGIRVDLLAGALSGSQYQATGVATVGTFTLPVTFTYTQPGEWTLAAASGSGRLTISGVNIATTSWAGSAVATGGTTSWSLQGLVSPSQPALVTGRLKIVGAQVRPVPTCPGYATAEMCALASPVFVRIEAATAVTDTTSGATPAWATSARGLEANLGSGMPVMSPSWRLLMPFRAVLEPVSGAFVLNGAFGRNTSAQFGTVRGPLVRSMSLVVANGDRSALLTGDVTVREKLGPFDVLVKGSGHVSVPELGTWNAASVATSFSDRGVFVTGTLTNRPKIVDYTVGTFAYSKFDTSSTILGAVVQVPANTFIFTGTMTAPKFLRPLGIDGVSIDGYQLYTEMSGVVKASAVLPVDTTLPSVPGITTRLDTISLGLEVPLDPALAEFRAFIAGQGTSTPAGRGSTGITLQGEYNFTDSELTLAFSATGVNGAAVWPDVFGVPGFDMSTFSVQIAVNQVFPYLSIGLAGTGTAPQKLRELMGLDTSTTVPTSFTANLSITSPCIEVTIGDPSSNTAIIAMPPGIGAVKATYATLRASLDGCRVGTVAAVSEIAPGIQIAANGSVLNNPVSVFASFDPTPVGPLRMPTYQAWTDVSLSNVPGIALDARFRTSVAVGGWTLTPKVQILGGITLGSNARIAVAGSCQLDVNGPRCDAAGSGAVSLYGFKLNMDLALQGLFTKNFLVSGSASARVAGVRVNVAGSFGTVGVTQGSTVDNPGLTYSFEASGRFPGFIVDGFSVKIEKTSTTFYMPTATFRASGTVGGVFAQVLGTSGRWSASAPFNPSMGSVTIPVSLTIPLGLASLPISLRLKLCLTGGCVGIAVPSVTVGFTFLKQRIDISDIPVDPSDWSFSYRLQRTVTRSGKAGDSWGGIKGTVSSSIDFSISNTSVSLRSLSASAKAYIGAFGSWNYVGTVGVEFRSGGEYCFTASGKKLCV